VKNILNYIKVSNTISTSGQPTKEQFKTIAKEGFDVVINLAMHNRGALKEEDKIVSKNNMIYYHIPITWEKPEIERLNLFLATLKMLQKQNKKVFIHCIKNYRVSVFIYIYKKHILKDKNSKLIAPKGYEPNEAWKKIMKVKI
jgi:protein tyrosine phosphatase (PTP) superfamily phosphohydrolase (DUF442 family)